MDNYICEKCKKEFSKKSNYNSHKKRKTPCKNDNQTINIDTTNTTNVKQETGLNRKTIDKYYTSENIVEKCMKLVKTQIKINKNDLCIEPSAGNGSFIKSIKLLFNNYKFYDLEPDNVEIIKQDYLLFDYDKFIKTKYNKIHVIGNPPFGRQSSLAIKFIKKSVEYCDSISFILPKSFKKDSLKKHIDLNFHLKYEYDLPDNSFIVDNKSYNVPCVFQIWIKKKKCRQVAKKLVPNKYKFVKKEDNPDISFRRVGVNAGNINKKNINDKSIQSHYFIKFSNTLTDETFNKILNINYNCKDNTVGPKSISKQELIKEFNKVID
jgi:predicted RNA methylase